MACATEGGSVVVASTMLSVILAFSLLLMAPAAVAQGDSTVREPPKITKPTVASENFYREGDRVQLQCQATGTPQPIYEWYWNGVQVVSDTNPNIAVDGANGTLTITDLDTDKEGFFNCRARNTFSNGVTAIAISPKTEIRVGRVENWDVSNVISTKTGTQGSYAFLECDSSLPVSFGPTAFKWYSVTADSSQSELAYDARRFIDSQGTLRFTYLTLEDQLTSAFYACALSNAVEGNIRVGSKKNLVVTAATVQERAPILEFSTGMAGAAALTFERNHVGQLECFFSGYTTDGSVPTISWFDDGEEITTGGRYELEREGRILKINALTESDDGQYSCVGTNSVGTASGTMTLNVTSAPIWLERLQSTTKIQGQNAVFNCDTRSAAGENAPNTPRWYKNGQRLDISYDPNKYEFQMGKKRMIVRSVQKSTDIACFQCYVSNSVGEVFSDGCLNVILPISIITQPQAAQEVQEGETVNLTVVATGDSLIPLSYRWFFKNVTYEEPYAPPLVTYDSVTKLAYINTSGFSDSEMNEIAGLYRREIYHTYESRVIEVDVTLEDTTTVAPVITAGFDYWIIGLIIGILLIIIVLIIICCVICRRKMREGDYPVDRKETAAGLDPEKELLDSGFSDLSRADYDYIPDKKSPNMDFDDNIPLGDDESFGSAEYGDDATNAFNEDGSFIGIYSKDKKGGGGGGPPAYQSESKV